MGLKEALKKSKFRVEKDEYQNFRDSMNSMNSMNAMRAQVQQQAMTLTGQNIAEVLLNNPNSWMVESCSLEAGYDPNMQAADIRIRFFDPQIATSFMWACHNSVQAAQSVVYGENPMYYTSSPIMQQAPEPEDKELPKGQHYVKDFGDD